MPVSLVLALAGSAILALGAFMPILSLPIVGSVNYFNNGQGDGAIILVLAVVSAVLAFRRRFEWLLTTGASSLAVLLFTFVVVQVRLSEMEASMNTELADNPFRGLAQLATASVQLQWGWAVLVLGGVLLIAASALRQDTRQTRKCPFCAEAILPDAKICKHCRSAVEPEEGVDLDAASSRPVFPRAVVITTVLAVLGLPSAAAAIWAITHCSIREWGCLWS